MNESEELGLHSYNQPSDPLSAREAAGEERREQFSLEDRLAMSRRIVCKECNWRGKIEDVLEARHPFIEDAKVSGCPSCKEVEPFRFACDEPGCWDEVCVGTPTPTGYRSTCSKHDPDKVAK